MLWRMFNELSVQCIFHASVAAEAPQGVTDQATEAMRCGLQCTWVGGRDASAGAVEGVRGSVTQSGFLTAFWVVF